MKLFFGFVVIVFVVVLIQWCVTSSANLVSPEILKLNELDAKAIDVSLEVVRMATTMSTLLFGAVGVFWFTRYPGGTTIPAAVRRGGIAAGILAALSIYFGYLFERQLIWMLAHRFVDLDTRLINWPLTAQVITFLCALYALGIVVSEGTR